MHGRYSLLLAVVFSLFIHVGLILSQGNQIGDGNVARLNAQDQVITIWLREKVAYSNHSDVSKLNQEYYENRRFRQPKAPSLKAQAQRIETETLPGMTMTFFSSEEVNRKAIPISNLDISMMSGWHSGLPIRLRLYINSKGNIQEIRQLTQRPDDGEFISQLKQLLFQTKCVPAKISGSDVNSYQDIEFSF